MQNFFYNHQFIVFDCDGVILNSNAVKTKAFENTLIDLGEKDEVVIDQFLKFHKQNGGVSRFEKIKHYYSKMKGQPLLGGEVDKAAAIFSKHVLAGLMNCDEIDGVRDLLENLKLTSVPLFVISGGEQSEVRSVLQARGLSGYFVEILGSPTSKLDNLKHIIESKRLNRPGLFFGDARADMEAAETFQMDFVYVYGKSEWKDGLSICEQKKFKTIKDFKSF